jgi:hypothetical protein
VTGWELSGGLTGGFVWLMVLASLGVVVLCAAPLMLSMAVYAGLSRLTPALVRAVKRPQRAPQQSRRPVSRAA